MDVEGGSWGTGGQEEPSITRRVTTPLGPKREESSLSRGKINTLGLSLRLRLQEGLWY